MGEVAKVLMRHVGIAVLGAALAVCGIVGAGILNIQILGLRAGALFHPWSNEPLGVVTPQEPVWAMISLVLLGALVLSVLFFSARILKRSKHIVLLSSFLIVSVALLIYSIAAFPVIDASVVFRSGIPFGWEGWVEHGGRDSSFQLIVVLALAGLFFATKPRKKTLVAELP